MPSGLVMSSLAIRLAVSGHWSSAHRRTGSRCDHRAATNCTLGNNNPKIVGTGNAASGQNTCNATA